MMPHIWRAFHVFSGGSYGSGLLNLLRGLWTPVGGASADFGANVVLVNASITDDWFVASSSATATPAAATSAAGSTVAVSRLSRRSTLFSTGNPLKWFMLIKIRNNVAINLIWILNFILAIFVSMFCTIARCTLTTPLRRCRLLSIFRVNRCRSLFVRLH